jgi:lipopolysaccharide/colanic/teichoic acid biosynthesis glycosyltransferase
MAATETPEQPEAGFQRASDAAGATWYTRAKRGVEWATALVLLLAATPLLATIAVALRATSAGPILYTQVRLGQGGRRFRIFKLRTMEAGCERVTGPVWAVNDDPRATRLGRWLRATHMDELPQLWNVLRGEMALIGPRPERPEIAAQIERVLPQFGERLSVRPGLSGLAQLLLPPDADLESVRFKLAHDLEYIRKAGPAVDGRIALATVLLLTGVPRRAWGWLVAAYAAREGVRATASAPALRLTVAEARRVVPDAGLEGLSKAA